MINTYKCKGCGAPIEFDASAGELVCEYCDTHMSVEELKKSGEQFEAVVDEEHGKSVPKYDIGGYHCDSCGAQLLVDKDTTATTCSFCGSSAIIRNMLEGTLKPAKVVPFKVTKDQAKDLFKKWTKKGIFTPSQFKKKEVVENITGMYVPYWLYDYNAREFMVATATRTRHETIGDYKYTHTDHYRIVRDGFADYKKVPADASEKMPDKTMDLLEPFDYSDLKDFEMPYLSGYQSEKYNYDSAEMAPRVESRVKDYIYNEVRKTIYGYGTVSVIRNDTTLNRKSATYTLLPVWLLTYRYKDKNYMLTINGQTGKQVGTLPIAKEKVFAWFGGLSIGLFGILWALGGYLG